MSQRKISEQLIAALLLAWSKVEGAKVLNDARFRAEKMGQELPQEIGTDVLSQELHTALYERIAVRLLAEKTEGQLLIDDDWEAILRRVAIWALASQNLPVNSATLRQASEQCRHYIQTMRWTWERESDGEPGYDWMWRVVDAIMERAIEAGLPPARYVRSDPSMVYCGVMSLLYTPESYVAMRVSARDRNLTVEGIREMQEASSGAKPCLEEHMSGEGSDQIQMLLEEERRVYDANTEQDLYHIFGKGTVPPSHH